MAAFAAFKLAPPARRAIGLRLYTRRAAMREPIALAEWKKEFGDPSSLLASYSRHPDDETAQRLVAAAGTLGIDLVRPNASRHDDLARAGDWALPRKAPAQRSLYKVTSEYCESTLQDPGSQIQEPPEALNAFLASHCSSLADLVSLLTKSTPPTWKSEPSLGPYAPVPNLYGQLHLQRLLVALALSATRSGKCVAAEDAFRASWNLNESVRDRPEVVSQLIALSVARMHAGLVRRIDVDPVEWRVRLVDHDYRSSLLRAMQCEVAGELSTLPQGSADFERATRADLLDFNRRLLVSLRDSLVSDAGEDISSSYESNEYSVGGIIAGIGFPNKISAFHRADRLAVDFELSEKILEAKALRRGLGRWPSKIEGIEHSRMRGAHWNYGVSSTGHMTINLSRELHWVGHQGLILPLKFESD